MSAIMKMIEAAQRGGSRGATVTQIVLRSGLNYNDALFIVRALLREGTLRRLKTGRIIADAFMFEAPDPPESDPLDAHTRTD